MKKIFCGDPKALQFTATQKLLAVVGLKKKKPGKQKVCCVEMQ